MIRNYGRVGENGSERKQEQANQAQDDATIVSIKAMTHPKYTLR